MSFEIETFKPTFLFRNGNLNTILTNQRRKIAGVKYERERISTPDNDFLDLDFSKVHSRKLVLILHGLEGSSDRQYARGMVKVFNQDGYDAVVMNHRSCSGELNLLPTTYHSGKTDDLDFVIEQLTESYDELNLIGFSLGGNVLIKYVGEKGSSISKKVKKAVAFSVPFHLEDSADQLAKKKNWIYMRRFLKTLKHKTEQKVKKYPELGITLKELNNCSNFIDFDNLFTAPVHGFKDAKDYWKKSSSRQFIYGISIPTLAVNAIDDPFLGAQCYPYAEAESNPNFTFIASQYGGHVGFAESFDLSKTLWTEKLALSFIAR